MDLAVALSLILTALIVGFALGAQGGYFVGERVGYDRGQYDAFDELEEIVEPES